MHDTKSLLNMPSSGECRNWCMVMRSCTAFTARDGILGSYVCSFISNADPAAQTAPDDAATTFLLTGERARAVVVRLLMQGRIIDAADIVFQRRSPVQFYNCITAINSYLLIKIILFTSLQVTQKCDQLKSI